MILNSYPCRCGHIAAFHEDVKSEQTIASTMTDIHWSHTITVVKQYQSCTYRNRDSYDYDPYDGGQSCGCKVFQPDNLKFLEQKANE